MPKFQITQFNTTKENLLIGIISDTHIPARAKFLPPKVKEIFQDVDLIIHAGDIVSLEVIEELEEIAPVIAVHGNMDPLEIKQKFPSAVCIQIYNWRIGLVHDSIFPWFEWEMYRIAKESDLDILIFGHTHRTLLKEGDVLLINPGSPTNPLLTKPSVALLNVSKNSYKGEIKHLK